MIKNARLIVGGESIPVSSFYFNEEGKIHSIVTMVDGEISTFYDGVGDDGGNYKFINFSEHLKFEQANSSAVSELYALIVESESELKLLAAKAIPSYGEQVSEVEYLQRCGNYHNKCAYIDGLYEALDVLKNV